MKMIEDPKLLAHTRRVAAERRLRAIQRKADEAAQQKRANVAAMHLIAKGGAR